MHPALLIDEVLQEILELCSDYGGQNTLSQAARCCQAWKDPALGKLWKRLSSAVPLLQLIPGLACLDGVYTLNRPVTSTELTSFRSYAHRVKYISHRRNIKIDPLVLALLSSQSRAHADDSPASSVFAVLPNLTTVQLTSSGLDTLPIPLGLSARLTHLDLDLGFKAKASQAQSPTINNTAVCEYLEQVVQVAPEIECLSLRGLASDRLNRATSSMQQLRVLSLRIGNTLTVNTLVAISRFPILAELEVHAGHIGIDDLMVMPSHNGRDVVSFPSLCKFRVRAHTSLIEHLLQSLQPDTLRVLRIEAEDPAQSPISWNVIFNTLATKAANTLQDLSIEHQIEIDDLELDQHNIANNVDTNPATNVDINTQLPIPHRQSNNLRLTSTSLRPLAHFIQLRNLTLDMTLPPDLTDDDISYLVQWWPNLEHLDLGSLPTLECTGEEAGLEWRIPKMTPASLAIFAKSLPRLTSLIVPMNIALAEPSLKQVGFSMSMLRRLTIGSPTAPDSDVLSRYLYYLFPSLMSVDGSAEYEDSWKRVQTAIHGLHRVRMGTD